jgi:hypothetical protein
MEESGQFEAQNTYPLKSWLSGPLTQPGLLENRKLFYLGPDVYKDIFKCIYIYI